MLGQYVQLNHVMPAVCDGLQLDYNLHARLQWHGVTLALNLRVQARRAALRLECFPEAMDVTPPSVARRTTDSNRPGLVHAAFRSSGNEGNSFKASSEQHVRLVQGRLLRNELVGQPGSQDA